MSVKQLYDATSFNESKIEGLNDKCCLYREDMNSKKVCCAFIGMTDAKGRG